MRHIRRTDGAYAIPIATYDRTRHMSRKAYTAHPSLRILTKTEPVRRIRLISAYEPNRLETRRTEVLVCDNKKGSKSFRFIFHGLHSFPRPEQHHIDFVPPAMRNRISTLSAYRGSTSGSKVESDMRQRETMVLSAMVAPIPAIKISMAIATMMGLKLQPIATMTIIRRRLWPKTPIAMGC